MSRIPVSSKTFQNANILSITVGTNCPNGGDSGHGGRTLFRLTNDASTDMSARVNGGQLQSVESVEIVLGGDTECETFIQALEYATSVLRAQTQAKAYASAHEEIE